MRRELVLAARRQAIVLAACAVALAAAVYAFLQRPADASELKIPVAELRSQDAELRLVNDAVARGLVRRFAQAHAGQLAHAVARSRDELDSLRPAAGLDDDRKRAVAVSAPLVEAAADLRDGRAPLTAAATAQLADAARELQSLEERLRR